MSRDPISITFERLTAIARVSLGVWFLIALGGAAMADSRTGAVVPTRGEIEASFDRFAAAWMEETRRLTVVGPAARLDQPGAAEAESAPGAQWSTEIRETTDATIPYLGLLRYVEEQGSCAAVARVACAETTTAVTEIFRFENGHWGY